MNGKRTQENAREQSDKLTPTHGKAWPNEYEKAHAHWKTSARDTTKAPKTAMSWLNTYALVAAAGAATVVVARGACRRQRGCRVHATQQQKQQ